VAIVATVGFSGIGVDPARASWCAVYQVGGTNCGFSTQQACQASVSGVGGFCNFIPDASDRRDSGREQVRRERVERRQQEAESDRKSRPRESSSAKKALAPGPGLIRTNTPAPEKEDTPPAAAPAKAQPSLDFAGARQLVLEGQYEAGIAALQALKFDDHPDIAAFIGFAHRKLGHLDEARNWYKRALAADPEHKLAISFYGMLRAENGDRAGAQGDLDHLKKICGGTECNEYLALAAVLAAQQR
jgi:tetratricopeptide (TPR) repeat protein